jgi:WD40 repeat protein
MIGKTLGGRYAIVRRLGGGGFSDTYLSIDKQLPKTPWCVVKRLKSQTTDTTILKTRRRLFDAEAAILYELGRKNDQIPRLLAHFEEDQEFYLVQEFIEGENLSNELTRGKRFDEWQVIALLQDILHVLKFVHQQNVIHRDIKPQNLIRRKEDGKIVLIDFGAVKQITTQIITSEGVGQTGATIAIGTPGYMPNEQQVGKPRFSSDIYAVGTVAIQALTGLSPGEMEDDPQTGEIVWRKQAQVSQRFADIIDKMVRPHFKDRYKSIEEILTDLRSLQDFALQGAGIVSTVVISPDKRRLESPNTVGKSKQNSNPNRLLAKPRKRWAVLSAVAIFSLGGGYGYWHSHALLSNKTTPTQIALAEPTPSPQGFRLTNTLTVHTGAVYAIAISPDGNTFVSASEDKTIKLWDLRSGELLRTFSGHNAEVVTVAISRDGQTLASGSRDKTVKLWNFNTGELIRTLNHPNWVQSVAFSPDGQMLAAGNRDKTVFVWNVKTGKMLCDFKGHSADVESVAISSDGMLLGSGSRDKTIRVINLQTERRVHTLAQHTNEVDSITMSPDGQTLISGGPDKILLWSLKTGQVVRTLPERSHNARAVTVSADGKTLVSSHQDNTIKLWNLQTGELMNTLSGHVDWVLSTAVSPDGQTLISGSRDKTIKIWRMQ